MFKYSISIKWSDEDNGFIAIIPELPGLSAFGETQEEATAEVKVVTEMYLESLREANETIPRPNLLVPYSGQLRLRMPPFLHEKLVDAAKLENISLNTYIVTLLAMRVGESKISNLVRELMQTFKNSLCVLGAQVGTDTMNPIVGRHMQQPVYDQTYLTSWTKQ